ncbi:MAG: imidazoleglycerol-phosphate dehydratase HisB [Clostridia bacterium]|nr:imidazoleglycerol-phosphate dehydratase HisB [Clostridia bacterium]
MRISKVERKTTETEISLSLNLDGNKGGKIVTGVGFLDHMLNLWARHGDFDLEVAAKGDVGVDDHHTTEDVGICLGLAFREALGTKEGIQRYGNSFVPMDEALVQAVVDISGRAYLALDGEIPRSKVGTFDTELVEEFLRAFAHNAGVNLHIRILAGRNTHHIIEAVFKALGRALREAAALDPRVKGVPSTKGLLQ